MSLTAPLILIILSILLLLSGKRRAGLYALVITTVIFFLIGSGLLPKFALAHLQTDPYVAEPAWDKQNLIVILGAGTVHWADQSGVVTLPFWANSRVLATAQLYLNCRKAERSCKVLASGGDPNHTGITEAASMGHALQEAGVDGQDLIFETKSRNTFENARLSNEIIQGSNFNRIYLVTSGFHMRRSLLYFAHFHVMARPAPADQIHALLTIIPISFNFVFFDIALHEFGGILQYYFYNLMGWNASPPLA